MTVKTRSLSLAGRAAEVEKARPPDAAPVETDEVMGLEELVPGRASGYLGYGWKSSDRGALARAVAGCRAVIGPVRGRAAQVGVDDGRRGRFDIPAAGDPAMHYVRFRDRAPRRMPPGVEEATARELDAVLGVWA